MPKSKDGSWRGWLVDDPSWVELQASRAYSVLNGCSFDLEETFVISALRPIGWGARLGMFVFSVIFCVICAMQEINPMFHYAPFSRERNAYGHLTGEYRDLFSAWGWVVLVVWALNTLVCVLSYCVGRLRDDNKSCYSQLFCCTRAALPGDAFLIRVLLLVLVVAILLGCATALGFTIFTLTLNAYVARNEMASLILGLVALCDVLATLADALSLGGPLGIRVRSYWASWLCAFRAVFLTPLEAILTLAFIVLVHPPWA